MRNTMIFAAQTKLDAGEVKSLSRAQKLWTEYRDANCSAERDLYRVGTGAQPAYLGCMDAMARARLRDLKLPIPSSSNSAGSIRVRLSTPKLEL